MKKRTFTLIACSAASIFWFFDSFIHYFVYEESQFEFVPADVNELWMRSVIFLLIVVLGITGDYFSNKILIKQKQLEATRIYNSMLGASHHILNNLLNQMQLFKLEGQKCKDFNQEVLELFDKSFVEATDLIEKLSNIENITEENIKASVSPKSKTN